jgi:phage gpG-like protein
VAAAIQIIGLEKLTIKLARMGKDIGSVRLMGQVGALVNLRIKMRTARGIDVKGRPFKSYTPEYRKRRSKEGHPVNNPNLFFTGSMFSALTYDAEKYQVTSYFMNTVDKFGGRNPAKAFFNDEIRPFFGLSEIDISEVEALVQDHLKQLLRKK